MFTTAALIAVGISLSALLFVSGSLSERIELYKTIINVGQLDEARYSSVFRSGIFMSFSRRMSNLARLRTGVFVSNEFSSKATSLIKMRSRLASRQFRYSAE
jgi:hypothetical protein